MSVHSVFTALSAGAGHIVSALLWPVATMVDHKGSDCDLQERELQCLSQVVLCFRNIGNCLTNTWVRDHHLSFTGEQTVVQWSGMICPKLKNRARTHTEFQNQDPQSSFSGVFRYSDLRVSPRSEPSMCSPRGVWLSAWTLSPAIIPGTLWEGGSEAATHHDRRHLSIKPATSTCTAQMRSLEEAIMILLHPLCWRLMLSAGGKCTLSFANTRYNYACLSRYYNLGLKKGPFRTSSAALVKHYRCVII